MKYQAYCLTCCGGGKDLGRPQAEKAAWREAQGHQNMGYGCNVTVLKREKPS